MTKINLLSPEAMREVEIRRRFPVEEVEVSFGEYAFKLLRPVDIDGLIHRAREEDELPFWAYLWPASVGLARYLANRVEKEIFPHPPRALELGVGLGLSGMVAARRGWEVIQTDLVPDSMRFARINACRNGLNIPGFIADWRSFGVRGSFDVIFASDILYEPLLHPALLRLIREQLRPGGRLLISDPFRVYGLKFMAKLEDLGWDVSAWDAPAESTDDTPVLIYNARPPVKT